MKITATREQIEVTRGGMLAGQVDVVRRYVYGPAEITVELDDGRAYLIPIDRTDEFVALGADEAALTAFAIAHGQLLA